MSKKTSSKLKMHFGRVPFGYTYSICFFMLGS